MSKTIGILNAIKHVVPTNIMRTIYNCLILCDLNYGTLLWGSQLNVNDKLHKLQKKPARIIALNSYFTHSEPLFKQLFLLKSYDIYKCQVFKFIYKLVNNQLPHYFNQFTFTFNNQHHHHATRTRHNVFIHRVNHEFAKRNIRFRAALTYNSTPANIIGKIYSHSFDGFFAAFIKSEIIKSYNSICNVTDCFSYRRHADIG